MFENRVLRRIFGPKRDKVTEEKRKVHNEGLNDLCCSSKIVWVIKLRSLRGGGGMYHVRESRKAYTGF